MTRNRLAALLASSVLAVLVTVTPADARPAQPAVPAVPAQPGQPAVPATPAQPAVPSPDRGIVEVMHTDGGAQTGMQMVTQRGKRVRVSLSGNRGQALRSTLYTDTARYAVRVGPRRTATSVRLRRGGTTVRCGGLRVKVRPKADRTIVSVPRRCLGDPAQVSLALSARG